MIRVALTGGVASGKSTALKILSELNCNTISSDKIVKELMQNDEMLKSRIKIAFNCVDDNGNINCEKLSKIIFNNQEAKQKLEDLIHPLVKNVRKKFFQRCEKQNNIFSICETPLLFEKDLLSEFDYSILITASLDTRIDRYIDSGKGDQDKFFQITKNQMLDGEKIVKADFVIKNNGTKEQLKEKLQQTLHEILKLHKSRCENL